MFRPQIIRRSLSLVKNVHTTPRSQIVNSAVRDGHDVLYIQRVRFARPPLFSRRRFIEFALYSTGTVAVFHYFLGEDEEENVEAHARTSNQRQRSDKGKREDGNTQLGIGVDKDNEEEVDHDDEEGEVLLSIPIGLARAKDRVYYKGSDPEWQEFIKLAKDSRRLTDVKKLLAGSVRYYAAKEVSHYERLIGPIDTRKGGTWIETTFPYGPPLEYERPVLEIDDKLDVYYTTRTVHTEHYQRFNRAAYPTAAFTSVYELSKLKIWQGWQTIKSYAGYPERTPQPGSSIVSIPPTVKSSSGGPNSESATQTSKQTTDSSAASGSTASTARPSSQQPTSPSKSPQGGPLTSSPPSTPNPNVAKLNLPVNPDPSMFTTTIDGFRNTYRKGVGVRPFVAPRGSIILSGMIQLVGARGSITLEVNAAFSPRHDQFQKIDIKIRSVQPNRQFPRRS